MGGLVNKPCYTISIHALRVEGDQDTSVSVSGNWRISIHALRVEGDFAPCMPRKRRPYFYPRPPGGGRQALFRLLPGRTDFYPRPPGGGRQALFRLLPGRTDFYPRPPGGGRPFGVKRNIVKVRISIHALRVEGDLERRDFVVAGGISIHALRVEGDGGAGRRWSSRCHFYPRPPGGGRPLPGWNMLFYFWISIHALRVEGDSR